MGFTINEKIKTELEWKDIALIAVMAGEYQERCKENTSKEEYKNNEHVERSVKLTNRLGVEMYAYPKSDFTEKKSLDINQYIKWGDIWEGEVEIDLSLIDDVKVKNIIKQYIIDKDVTLDYDECFIDGPNLVFCFSESGGQNESDTQGWSRDYQITVDKDFIIIDAIYEQG